MSILPSHSLIFNSKATVKPHSFTSFLPSSSISTTTTKYSVKSHKWSSRRIECMQTLSLPRGVRKTVSGRPSARYKKLSQFSIHASFSSSFNKPKENDGDSSDDKLISFVDEWGEKSDPELRPVTKLSDSDPPIDIDEWGSNNSSSGIEDEWGEKSFPELRPVKTVSDSDPPIDEDEWVGAKLRKLVSKKTHRVKIRSVSDIVDEWGENSEPEPGPDPIELSESDPPKDDDEWGEEVVDELGENLDPEPRPLVSSPDKDKRVGAKLDKPDPTHSRIAPLSSLVPKLGKLMGNKTDRGNKTMSFVNEWGGNSEPEPQPVVSLPDSDAPEDKDKRVGAHQGKPDPTHTRIDPLSSLVPKLGKLVGNKTDRVKNEGVSSNNTASFVDELGENSEPEPQPVVSLPGSDPPEDKDKGVGANQDRPDLTPTRISPLSSLVPKLGKLVGNKIDQVKNEGISSNEITSFVDELGEKSEPVSQVVASLLDSDSLKDVDEWVETELVGKLTAVVLEDGRVAELKRRLIDTVYGTDFGLRASSEVRAEALELVSQLEAANPTPNPVESPELLDGNWILVFTAFSELLPLLAVGTIPLLKVEKISQTISTSSLTIENSTTLSTPVATLSFSATAAFEVRSPSRIQVEFKEGTLTFRPPEILSKLDLPRNMDIFGQNISLSPLQQSLGPLENTVAGIARTISGLPSLKVPIPSERTKSWLITTYLDNDLRISRGDGGIFVLVKEESSFLEISSKVLSRYV